MENKQLEKYTSDNPINSEIQDRFQRFGFSKRIAQTIIDRKSKESIVFGLYGEWGEVKSSVLNFIESELNTSDAIITIKFNPWRYHDEESLLKNYFDIIASKLDKSIESKADKVADWITKFGGFSKIFNIDNKDISNAISDSNIEIFKERVEEFLSESTKKLVIFIDDIDRLDKQEIYTLFRLVKLTADFSNTVYILSFDKEMVAAAIGNRYGEGDKKAGENFLEKIIQVPISLPKAQSEALRKYSIELLNNALASNSIDIQKEDANRFILQFDEIILSQIKTPRMAVRYGNAISFSVPLLFGEVNIADLLLIEAIKIFYPNYYAFIKSTPSLFLSGSYKNVIHLNNARENFKNDLNLHLNTIGNDLTTHEQADIKELLCELFPKLKSLFENYSYSNEYYEKWNEEKRICSVKYFDRYFSYTVLEGDISDVEIDLFIESISQSTIEEIRVNADKITEKASIEKLIEKLLAREKNLDWSITCKIGLFFASTSISLHKNGSLLNFNMDSSLKRAVIFIYQFLSKNKTQEGYLAYIKEIVKIAPNFYFVHELLYWLRYGEDENSKLVSEKEILLINRIILEKEIPFLEEGGDIFTKYPDEALFIIDNWLLNNKTEAKSYIKSYIEKDEKNVLLFLKAFINIIVSSAYPDPYKSDFTENNFNEISNYTSLSLIKMSLNKLYKTSVLKKEEVIFNARRHGPNSDINIARQFFHWYDLNKSIK